MKHNIILLILFLLLLNCNSQRPGQQGGEDTNGGSNNNRDKEVEDLKKRLADRNKSYKSLRDRLADKEGDLEETEDDLDDVEEKLDEVEEELRGSLTPTRRRELEAEQRRLEGLKRTLEGRVADLEAERNCWKKTKVGLCDRTGKVKTKILAKFSDISDCADINYCHLETITDLDLSGSFASGDTCDDDATLDLQEDDLLGFTKLETLNLSGNCLVSLEGWAFNRGFFPDLDSIRRINLQETNIVKLSSHFFDGLLDTLEDGGVLVQSFIYCNDPEAPFKSKIGPSEEITPHDHHSYRSIPNMKTNNCY